MIDVEFDDVYCDESMTNPRIPGKVSLNKYLKYTKGKLTLQKINISPLYMVTPGIELDKSSQKTC
jgi:hypothetical protein